jgi:hypothetical protein
MKNAAHLDSGALQVALQATDTLLSFRDFTPTGGLFVMYLGRFRDDLRDVLEMESLRPAERGTQIRALGELRSIELSMLARAVMILRQPRFTRLMDDPKLIEMLEGFEEDLNAHKRKLAEARAATEAPQAARAS